MSFRTSDGIHVFTRADWQARAPKAAYTTLGGIRSVVIHHGGPVGAPRETFAAGAQTCRDWQNFHMNVRGWNDIGYHYLVDAHGRLYQGRPTWAIGAHVEMENTHRVGLNFMQDGRYHGLTADQEKLLRKLIRRKHRYLHLPSLKSLVTHAGSDWGIFGHLEVPGQSTECPGDKILADLHRIIREET
jgi:hypothetical protein